MRDGSFYGWGVSFDILIFHCELSFFKSRKKGRSWVGLNQPCLAWRPLKRSCKVIGLALRSQDWDLTRHRRREKGLNWNKESPELLVNIPAFQHPPVLPRAFSGISASGKQAAKKILYFSFSWRTDYPRRRSGCWVHTLRLCLRIVCGVILTEKLYWENWVENTLTIKANNTVDYLQRYFTVLSFPAYDLDCTVKMFSPFALDHCLECHMAFQAKLYSSRRTYYLTIC